MSWAKELPPTKYLTELDLNVLCYSAFSTSAYAKIVCHAIEAQAMPLTLPSGLEHVPRKVQM